MFGTIDLDSVTLCTCSIAFSCSQRGRDVAKRHVKRHLAVLTLEKRFKSISHISVEHFTIARPGFFVLLASFAVQRKE